MKGAPSSRGHSDERKNVRASGPERCVLARAAAAAARERKKMVIGGDDGRKNRYKEIVLLLGGETAGRS